MSIRDQLSGFMAEMVEDLPPVRARQILVHLTALYFGCLKEVREADHAYAIVLLRFLDADEAASRAKIRAETSMEYLRKREAHDTTEVALEAMRNLKAMLRSVEEEMRLAR